MERTLLAHPEIATMLLGCSLPGFDPERRDPDS